MNQIIVWDLETIPDLKGFAAANDPEGGSDDASSFPSDYM
jgi:hypothetical protein